MSLHWVLYLTTRKFIWTFFLKNVRFYNSQKNNKRLPIKIFKIINWQLINEHFQYVGESMTLTTSKLKLKVDHVKRECHDR